MITYNRLDWSKETFAQIKNTIIVPHRFIIVDNNSNDGTQDWIEGLLSTNQIDDRIINKENEYPGKACNQGWEKGLRKWENEITHIMRTDNDMTFEYGWDIHAADAFRAFPNLGQFSLMSGMQHHPEAEQHNHQQIISQNGVAINVKQATVSGHAIFPKEIWTKRGIRWVEHRWKEQSQEAPRMSLAVRSAGYQVCQTVPTVCKHMSLGNYDEYLDYHEETFRRRGGVMWARFQERLEAERAGKYENGQRIK